MLEHLHLNLLCFSFLEFSCIAATGRRAIQVMDALAMDFPDDTFDLVWACESGEHMPNKKAYIEEMARVLKPGGLLVMATWCQREDTVEAPFTKKEMKRLDYLYSEWTHPHFISIDEYERHMTNTGVLDDIHTEDWWAQTIASWVGPCAACA